MDKLCAFVIAQSDDHLFDQAAFIGIVEIGVGFYAIDQDNPVQFMGDTVEVHRKAGGKGNTGNASSCARSTWRNSVRGNHHIQRRATEKIYSDDRFTTEPMMKYADANPNLYNDDGYWCDVSVCDRPVQI